MLRVLNDLTAQARRQGGDVVKVIGNHEVLNLDGETRYATPHALRVQGGVQGRRQLFGPGGEAARAVAGPA